MARVTYITACADSSGYAESARNNIAALAAAGIDTEVLPVSFESFRSDLGKLGHQVKSMYTDKPTAPIRLIHTTPNLYHNWAQPNYYNIGYTAWETSRLPPDWVEHLNKMNEVWVPSEHNKTVFLNSGVTVPLYVIPHTFNFQLYKEERRDNAIEGLTSDEFVFYSVFQWTERKGPAELLKAYLTEFTAGDNVALVLKTYMVTPGNPAEKERIIKEIMFIKDRLHLNNYPKILLISRLLSRGQIFSLHDSSDCYLSFHRDEGFGVPIAEAMLAGNPVICTNYGGSTQFVKPEHAYPVDYKLTPVFGMPWENYKGNTEWADIDIMDARKKMRYVYNNKSEAREMGVKGQEYVRTNLSWERIGSLMKERIDSINK